MNISTTVNLVQGLHIHGIRVYNMPQAYIRPLSQAFIRMYLEYSCIGDRLRHVKPNCGTRPSFNDATTSQLQFCDNYDNTKHQLLLPRL